MGAGSREIAHLHVALARHEGRVVGAACFSALHCSRRDAEPLAAEIILFAGGWV
jgi:predicted DNA-binding protein with PD1-like motif